MATKTEEKKEKIHNKEESRLRNVLRRQGWPEHDIKKASLELWPNKVS